MPKVRYLDAQGGVIHNKETQNPAFSVYTISIKKGIRYQPHPALAKNAAGAYRYCI